MVCFPNAKINIGLNITSKRSDGFHNIETIFYPIQLSDVLEFTPSKQAETIINTTGISLNIAPEENICYKAYKLIKSKNDLPILNIKLHKVIPTGAGLGGGSSDAAFLIKELNEFYRLGHSNDALEELVAKLGSDCAFFIKNRPVFAYDRGQKFEEIDLDLSNYYIYLIKPEIFISTSDAYAAIKPSTPKISVKELVKQPISSWKDSIFNDFESEIFKKHPILEEIKTELYNQGALYAAMSGSGSSIYGLFEEEPSEIFKFDNHFTWISKL